jgi:hypothetical protein
LPFSNVPWSGPSQEQRQQLSDMLRVRGGSAVPSPPRSIIAQPGNGKIVLTWNADPANPPNCKPRIYVGNENSLHAENPAGVNSIAIPVTGGAAPPVTNVFVSFVSPLGAESRKVPIQSSAAVQSGSTPPPDPPVPPGWNTEPSGGAFNNNIPNTLLGVR